MKSQQPIKALKLEPPNRTSLFCAPVARKRVQQFRVHQRLADPESTCRSKPAEAGRTSRHLALHERVSLFAEWSLRFERCCGFAAVFRQKSVGCHFPGREMPSFCIL